MSGKNSNSMKPIVIFTAIVFILITALVILNNKQTKESGDITFASSPPIENQPTLGNPDAPVTVVEFGDYKCPSCKEWSEYIFPQLKKDFIDTGKISFSYVNVLFHEEESYLGSLAAEAVWNQDQEAFWAFSKALYQAQPAQQEHDNHWLTVEKVMEVAENTVPQLDLEKLKQDVENKTYQEAVLLDDQLVEEFQIKLTPSIMINGTMVEDPFDYERIKELIEGGL